PADVAEAAGTRRYLLCGALQLVLFLGYTYLVALGAAAGYEWISAAPDGVDLYVRLVLWSITALVVVSVFPLLVKWTLIGRWKAGRIPIWSPAYVRFWTVKTLIRSNPCALLFVGSPLYVLYLRALGAKIGPGVAIFSRRVPVCADLITIG